MPKAKRTKEQIHKYNQTNYAKHGEKLKEKAKEYYHNNKDKVLEVVKQYRDNNRPMIQEKGREYYRRKLPNRLLNAAKARARTHNLEFTITLEDIVVPTHCPLLGIELRVAEGRTSSKAHSPSLDRFDCSKGYIKGNVWVISQRANTMKSDATLDELVMLVENLKTYTGNCGSLLYNGITGRMLEIKDTL